MEGRSLKDLPSSLKLKGEEDYAIWAPAMISLAKGNRALKYIHENGATLKPKECDEFDLDGRYTKELQVWKTWEAGDSNMKNLIRFNVKKTPMSLIQSCKSARDMWTTLQNQYEGSRAALDFNPLDRYNNSKYEDHPSLEKFIIAYKHSIEQLSKLDMSPPEKWHTLRFIMALSDSFPIWAERQRSNFRNKSTSLTLAALIMDITDEARIKDRIPIEGEGVLYGGEPPNSKSKKDRKKG